MFSQQRVFVVVESAEYPGLRGEVAEVVGIGRGDTVFVKVAAGEFMIKRAEVREVYVPPFDRVRITLSAVEDVVAAPSNSVTKPIAEAPDGRLRTRLQLLGFVALVVLYVVLGYVAFRG
jgi:hypothetical protein